MKTTKTVLEVTGLKYKLYDSWRFGHFVDWCYIISKKFSIAPQVLVKHDGILNWYCDMWILHVEKQFLLDNEDFFSSNDHLQIQEILKTYPEALREMHPDSLIRMIKHQPLIKSRV